MGQPDLTVTKDSGARLGICSVVFNDSYAVATRLIVGWRLPVASRMNVTMPATGSILTHDYSDAQSAGLGQGYGLLTLLLWVHPY